MIHKTTRSILSVLLAALLLVTSVPLTPAFADGGAVSLQSESAESRALEPAADGVYQIATANDLREFAQRVKNGELADANAVLTANIDLNNQPWYPIGTNSNKYTGNFNGDGHTISGLYIDSSANYQGLFGYVSGTVQNLTVSGSVSGNNYVGGVVGYNGGTVENCYNTGTVTGNNFVGGIVGDNYPGASVKNCYNTGSVSGNSNISNVGGVVGYNSASVTNCYNTGEVSGNNHVGGVVGWNISSGNVTNCYNTGAVSGGEYVGGVVGQNNVSCNVTNCYNTGSVTGPDSGSDSNVGGVVGYNVGSVTGCYFLQGTAGSGIGNDNASTENVKSLTADEFAIQSSFTNSSWDFDKTWKIESIFGRPTLQDNAEIGGTANNPYKIFTATQLAAFRDLVNDENDQTADPDAHAVLMENIDLSEICGESAGNWTPIGTSEENAYTGNFDGQNFKISGLYIKNTSSDTDYQGLFGYVGTGGTVKDLSVSGSVSVSVGEDVGGVVGLNRGSVEDCDFTGSVSGSYYVGGVVGLNRGSNGVVENCHNAGKVSGSTTVGGVVGYNHSNGRVKNCYNTGSGTVTGTGDYVGGVVGYNHSNGTVENCHNIGAVNSSGNSVGGVVGKNEASVTNSYNTSSVKGDWYVGGVVGNNEASVTNCYNTGNVTSSGNSVGGVVGNNEASVTNCYNTGAVNSSGNYVGGVVGWNSSSGTVENCYNTGTVSDGTTSGGVVGQNSGSVTNCYYQQHDPAIFGIGGTTGDNSSQTEIKSLEDFHSGEVAYLLQSKQTTPVWGQSNLGTEDSLPTLVALDKDENAKPVYKVAFISDDTEIDAKYANNGMTVGSPTTNPTKEGYTFAGWFTETSGGSQWNFSTAVTENMTLYAQWTPHTYSITASPSALNFGSITEGEERPAAQNVTITNTGNQAVTLNPPTATNFEIAKIDDLALDAGESVKLTIQPKDKLPRGSYSEQIAISNTNGEKATITATFTVKEPPYTGKYSYEVSTSVGDNGAISVDRYATEGDKVTIDVTPDQAYKLDDLTVTAHGKDVELTANDDGTYTFTMPSADVRITATFAEDPDWTPDEPEEPTTDVSDLFIDIAPDAWYKDAIQYAYDNGLMTGVSATEFAPEQTTTRAMIVSILARLEGVTTAQAAGFADVDDEWYATAVNWAANVGVVNGYEDNTFQPNTAITREQLAAILMNYAAYKGEDVSNRADLTSYTDQPSTWAEEAMSWAVAEGLISGVTADTLQPQGAATRAQVAAILQRFLSE